MKRISVLAVAAVPILVLSFVACGGGGGNSTATTKLGAAPWITMSPGNQQNIITWGSVNGAASYNLYWDTQPGVTAGRATARIGTRIAGITGTTYLQNGLTNGDTYYYTVAAVSQGGIEGESRPSTGGATPSNQCPSGQWACGNNCNDLISDNNNCGACGTACASGQSCSNGQCGGACASGQATCSGTCVDTQTDHGNCGACGKACAVGQICANGACGSAQPSTPGITSCSGVNTDLTTDNQNCGSCGNSCGCGAWAPDGIHCTVPPACVAGACVCASGWNMCGGYCSDFQNDLLNCGSCGHACAGGQICTAGVCTANLAQRCPRSDQTICSGTCVNTQTDHGNCGACGYVCGSAQTCTSGNCTLSCTGSTPTNCSGVCVDTTADSNNCGACGYKCTNGVYGFPFCFKYLGVGTCV